MASLAKLYIIICSRTCEWLLGLQQYRYYNENHINYLSLYWIKCFEKVSNNGYRKLYPSVPYTGCPRRNV